MPPPPASSAADSANRLGRALAETQDFAILVLDPHGVIVDWLGAAEAVLGYTAQEAVGQPFGIIFTPEDRDAALDKQELELARRTGRSQDERWHLRKGGRRFWGSGMLHLVHDAAGGIAGYCKVLRDRGDVRTLLDEMQHRIDAQAQELERRRRFMVRLGHELRNPLAPIRAAAYTIQRLGDEKVKRPCEVLERQVEVMVRLLDDLTEATRADAHVSRILPQKLVLQEALRTAADGVQAAAQARRQQLVVVLPDVPITLEADPARLQQMLLNLLGNAIKYTPPGGHVTLAGSIEGDEAAILVEDDGPGIPDDLLPHLFELFTRGTRHAAFEDGLGVGLAVVKELATLHGGSITARGRTERGSAFTLRLPLVQPAPAPPGDLP